MNLKELSALQSQIAVARERGERLLRGFWQGTAVFGFLGFWWVCFVAKTSATPGISQLPFIVIGLFGLIVIGVLVSGDMIFFNKAYDWEQELDEKQSALAAETLGLAPGGAALRFSTARKYFVLTVSKTKETALTDKISLTTPALRLTYHLDAATLEEAFALLEKHRDQLTQF